MKKETEMFKPIIKPNKQRTQIKYFIKLINGEKLNITQDEFTTWLNKNNGDYLVIKSRNNNQLYIFREQILLGYTLKFIVNEEQNGK